MALRMTEEEYAEWQKRNKPQKQVYIPQKTDYGAICGTAPEIKTKGTTITRCAPAAPSGVSVADMAEVDVRGIADTMERKEARPKYGNRRVEVNGITFDSQHEANVYQELMLRVRAGELKCVCRQVKFDLGGGCNAGKDSRYQYIADFVTIDQENRVDVLDAKSEITRKNRTYINKKKQMLAEWGIAIREV